MPREERGRSCDPTGDTRKDLRVSVLALPYLCDDVKLQWEILRSVLRLIQCLVMLLTQPVSYLISYPSSNSFYFWGVGLVQLPIVSAQGLVLLVFWGLGGAGDRPRLMAQRQHSGLWVIPCSSSFFSAAAITCSEHIIVPSFLLGCCETTTASSFTLPSSPAGHPRGHFMFLV